MRYVAILGRQPELSAAELEAQFGTVHFLTPQIAEFTVDNTVSGSINSANSLSATSGNNTPNINRLGGTIKILRPLGTDPLEFLRNLPDGKITLGISDYSPQATPKTATKLALKFKKQVGRSLRLIPNRTAALGAATVLHNKLGANPRKVELAHLSGQWFISCGVQNINTYTKRDQARPARDAKVGMLSPKLAQILINLCGPLPTGARVLDPFCGTGVILQEAALMGYRPYGTDLSERMVNYSQRNLVWLAQSSFLKKQLFAPKNSQSSIIPDHQPPTISQQSFAPHQIAVGDATNYQWQLPIAAVACETYLGPPLSQPPIIIKLKTIQQEIRTLLLSFLKNLSHQLSPQTPVVLAVPAWLRPDGHYAPISRDLLDEITSLGYNEVKFKCLSGKDLLYHREGQIVARQIIVLRKS